MRKILALVLAITTVFALAVPAMADDTFEFDVNNANFHCNDIEGENGRVWPDLSEYGVVDGKGNGGGNNANKTDEKFSVTRFETSTKWTLDADDVVCPFCERSDWITFSNNSGVPNGNNVQFQHDGSSKKWITINIQVIYHFDIPECDFPCVNDDAECGFVCTCEFKDIDGKGVCEFEDYEHDCALVCGKGHTCPFDADLTCGTVCGCEFSYEETIINEQGRALVYTSDGSPVDGFGYLFEHTAPNTWMSGNLVSGSPISELLFNDATFDVYYEGEGDCECECDKPECDAACEPCTWPGPPPPPPPPPPPEHAHIAICDNCKNGKGGNHKNCERANPENNTNYFCLDCGKKIGSWHGKKGWENDIVLACECPICN